MQKEVQIKEIKISYIEKNPDKEKTILFVHGNSLSSKSFIEQFQSEKFKDLRLIALDLPGHGDSEKLNNYNIPVLASYLSGFVKKLALKDFILVGHSLGGHIVSHTLKELDPKAIVLIANTPIATQADIPNLFLPHPNLALINKYPISKSEVIELINSYFKTTKDYQAEISDFLNTDKNFKTTFVKSLVDAKFENEIELIKQKKIPVLMTTGAEDGFINPEYLESLSLKLWKDKVHYLPGGHCLLKDNPNDFNNLLYSLISESLL